MEIKWDIFINAIKDGTTQASIQKLQSISQSAIKEGQDFVIKQCQLVNKYLDQKAKKLITEEEFNSLMTDLSDVLKLQSLKASVASRQLIQDLLQTCLDIVTNNLGKLIVF